MRPCRGRTYNGPLANLTGAVSSAVRAPRSHRGGQRFKSSIAHHQGVPAEVAERQTRYVQGVVSLRACGFKSRPRHQGPCSSGLPVPPRHSPSGPRHSRSSKYALVAQWIERSPAEAEAVGSSPAKRAIFNPTYPMAAFIAGVGLHGMVT